MGQKQRLKIVNFSPPRLSMAAFNLASKMAAKLSFQVFLEFTVAKRKVMGSKLQVTPTKLQVTPTKLQVTLAKLQVTPTKLQVTLTKLQVTRSKLTSLTAETNKL